MKKNILIALLILIGFKSFGQYTLECKENKSLAKAIQEEIPDDQVLFIFNTEEALTIKHKGISSSAQRVTSLVNGLQRLYIPFEYSNGTILLSNGNLKYVLDYGNVDGVNTFNEVKGGDIVCFDVMIKMSLKVSETTINYETVTQIENEKDALVEIYVEPSILEFLIKDEDYISIVKKKTKNGIYKILVKPNQQNSEERKITLIKDGYADLIIPLGKVSPKDFHVFAVKDENIELGKHIIRSIPKNAKISIKDEPYYNRTNPVTPSEYNGKSGKYYIVLEKSGYKTYKGYINISENTKPIRLIPKLGFLSIPAKGKSVGAEVSVDNKSIGKIPITNHELIEGNHVIRFSKESYIADKNVYRINVAENQRLIFDDFELSRVKRVRIKTVPKNAKVYIGDNPEYRKSDFTTKLTEGLHDIKIVKKHFKTYESSFTVNEDKDTHVFTLEEGSYSATFDSSPASEVYVDGKHKGHTPQTVSLQHGYHKVMYKRNGVLTETHKYNINEEGEKHHSNLYPSSFSFLGVNYGVGQIGFDLGVTYNRFYIGGSWLSQMKKDKIEVSDLTIHNVEVVDIESYGKEYGRVYPEGDFNKNTSYSLKIGYMFRKPFPIIFSAGVASITTDKFYKVHKAKNNYELGGLTVLHKNELFSERELEQNEIIAFTGGIMIPLFKTIYISGEYFTNSDIGPGFSFGVGMLLNMNYKNY